ncbi:cytochrome P450 6k1 isoform X1 [Halyomorpha halys]|uniref:cytochrome P450 6k1 isoform X1 n=1 Tax=Halyomorpha halys TaxID=286706 RepID=UPI0006D4CADF|nr:cytochrome P450 6k1-like isoform X2 [Halyomorpha halys]
MLLAVLLTVFLIWFSMRPLYWRNRGVYSSLPWPVVGNCLSAFYLSTVLFWERIYHSSVEPYIGIFFFTRPALVLRDPEIITEVLEKKAPLFNSHGMHINRRDPMGESLFHLNGGDWKEARSKLSAYFSPAKVKAMNEIAERSVTRMLEHLEDQLDTEVEFHSVAMKLSIDVTAASLFGLESKVFQDGNDSEYFVASKDLNSPLSMLKVFINFVSPRLFEILKLNSFSTRTNEFISNIVHGAMEACRNVSKLQLSQNFIQGMVQLKEKDKNKFAVSQGAVLWVGGVETTAATLSFCLFELAQNPALQDQLRDLSSPSTDQLLRQVLAETLRKYPPFSLISRCCTTDCALETGLSLKKGTLIFIPAYSIHHDPKIYPEPESFRPGREYPRGAYLPFGSGPRTCIGKRMAETVLELALIKLLQKYRFTSCDKSSAPLKLSPRSFFTSAEGGIWLKVEKIRS